MASVMHLPLHRVRLVEEPLEAIVVGAQDVAVDVVGFLAAKEVRYTICIIWIYDANGLSLDTLETNIKGQALRDREAGSMNNRDKPTDDGLRQDRHANRVEGGRDRGNYDGRGGRGARAGRGGRGNRDDRHTRGVPKYATLPPPPENRLYSPSFFTATTSSKPTSHGAHLPATPNGKTNKLGQQSRKLKRRMKVQLADGMLPPPQETGMLVTPLSPARLLPQLTLTVPLRLRDLLLPRRQLNQLRIPNLRTTAALTPTTSPSKRRRN